MEKINAAFENIDTLLKTDGQTLTSCLMNSEQNAEAVFQQQKGFLKHIFARIDTISLELKNDDTILISVKNQKILRTCFQLITSFGISRSLIPGLGISLSKRCSSATILPMLNLNDENKYDLLTECTNFFTRCYSVPVLKNIIVTLHLSDYLAALIQLAFAPLKKPGSYGSFTMSQELYDKLIEDRQRYTRIYENLVINCFQPILMKELLVLQSVSDPSPPMFVKRVIAKEMSRRLLAPGGLLSLTRCFIESYSIDTGFEWKKIDLICKIVSARHGNSSEEEYLNNICSQLKSILLSKNAHYLSTAVACILSLYDKYPDSDVVQHLIKENFQVLVYDEIMKKPYLPGTIILSASDVERAINVLHACVCTTKLDWHADLLQPNLYVLFILGVKCIKNEDVKTKLRDILLKLLESLHREHIRKTIIMLLFGKKEDQSANIVIEEYEAGLTLKFVSNAVAYPRKDSLLYFVNLFKGSSKNALVQAIFQESLQILIDLTEQRRTRHNREVLIAPEDEPMLLGDSDEKYVDILQLLSEICTYPKVISSLKEHPIGALNFIEYFLMRNFGNTDDECVTIALILLNTILENSNFDKDTENIFSNIMPVIKKMVNDDSGLNNILCKEALSLLTSNKPRQSDTACAKAITDAFDSLLPVRAHGILELTKLIEAKDPETISKKHFIFCLFQEQLKDMDSYIYLAAINGIAALGSVCTEDVLHVLCTEFSKILSDPLHQTNEHQSKSAELKMKIGDIIVKVTRKLGEMAIQHKTILLNTMLSECRHADPLIRTSALSNLAEIALVLHYRVGSIIYEILLCIWSVIETDPAVECRRAAVMVISSLLKGLGKETLIQLKENLLPLYRTLKELYQDPDEDSVLRLHAQVALEELNDVVKQFLFPEVPMDKQIFVLDKPETALWSIRMFRRRICPCSAFRRCCCETRWTRWTRTRCLPRSEAQPSRSGARSHQTRRRPGTLRAILLRAYLETLSKLKLTVLKVPTHRYKVFIFSQVLSRTSLVTN